MREATEVEIIQQNAKIVIEGIASHRLTHEQLIDIYKHLNGWAHELNPYVVYNRHEHLIKNFQTMLGHVVKLSNFISNHVISIQGHGFFCVLKDRTDGLTKVISLQKIAT
jgi:hypothetical protein